MTAPGYATAVTHLDELVEACQALRDHRRIAGAEEAALMSKRRAAVVGMVVEDGVPQAQVPQRAYHRFKQEGWSDEDIQGMGLSLSAVRKLMRETRGGGG